MKHSFEQCGLDDTFGHFYTEMDSWKLWELDASQSRRTGIKTLAYEWLRQWARSFRTQLEELQMRLKTGDIHVQISNATSRALTGDTSLAVCVLFFSILYVKLFRQNHHRTERM